MGIGGFTLFLLYLPFIGIFLLKIIHIFILAFCSLFWSFFSCPVHRLLCAMSSITPSETIRMNRAGSSVSSSLGHQSEGELEGEWEEFGLGFMFKVFGN